jgi:hypothetical protein
MCRETSLSLPSQQQIRAELEAMVVGDLLGRAGGENEKLTERTVRDRYLVGILAPSSAGAREEGGQRIWPTVRVK